MKIYTILGAVALTALTFSCTEAKVADNTSNTIKTTTVNAGDLKIAYYELDSIKVGFDYFEKVDTELRKEGEKLQAEYESLGQKLVGYQQRMQAKVDAGELSYLSEEFQKIEPNIKRMQQNLINFEQSKLVPFQQKQAQETEVLMNKIVNGGKRFAKDNGITLFLIKQQGSEIAYIEESMDMTAPFMQFLNDEQASFEKDLEGETAE